MSQLSTGLVSVELPEIPAQDRYREIFAAHKHASDYRANLVKVWVLMLVALAPFFAWLYKEMELRPLTFIVPIIALCVTLVMWSIDCRHRPAIRRAKDAGRAIEIPGIPKAQRFFEDLGGGVPHGVMIDRVSKALILIFAILALYLWISGGELLVSAASQPPSGAPPQSVQPPEEQATGQDVEDQNAGQSTATPQPPADTPPETVRQTTTADVGDRNESEFFSNATFNFALILLTGALVVLTGGLVRVGYLQRRTTLASNEVAKSASEIANTANQMNHAIHRAYVDLSHQPPGLALSSSGANVQMTAVNHGQTPADLSGVVLRLFATNDPLPDTPPYGSDNVQPLSIFLNAGTAPYGSENRSTSLGPCKFQTT